MVFANTSTETSLLANANQRIADAIAIARLARQLNGSRAVSFEDDGISVTSDRVAMAMGGRMIGETAALKSARANAAKAASLLQTADAALSTVADKLAEMKTLATQASTTTMSTVERAIVDGEFATLRSEIDDIATITEFAGLKLLQGDAAYGGASSDSLTVSFTIGSGTRAEDKIVISIESARVADLDANLASATLSSSAAAATALASVNAAIDKVGDIRAAIAGNGERVFSAAGGAGSAIDALGDAIADRTDVNVALDTANVVARKIIEQGDVAMPEETADQLRKTLLDANLASAKKSASPDTVAKTPESSPSASTSGTPAVSAQRTTQAA